MSFLVAIWFGNKASNKFSCVKSPECEDRCSVENCDLRSKFCEKRNGDTPEARLSKILWETASRKRLSKTLWKPVPKTVRRLCPRKAVPKTVRNVCPRKPHRRLFGRSVREILCQILLGSSVQEHGIALCFQMYIFDLCILMKHKML